MKRFMLHPGWVQPSVGPAEYVSAHHLVELYQVRPDHCLLAEPEVLRELDPAVFAEIVHLYPHSGWMC